MANRVLTNIVGIPVSQCMYVTVHFTCLFTCLFTCVYNTDGSVLLMFYGLCNASQVVARVDWVTNGVEPEWRQIWQCNPERINQWSLGLCWSLCAVLDCNAACQGALCSVSVEEHEVVWSHCWAFFTTAVQERSAEMWMARSLNGWTLSKSGCIKMAQLN